MAELEKLRIRVRSFFSSMASQIRVTKAKKRVEKRARRDQLKGSHVDVDQRIDSGRENPHKSLYRVSEALLERNMNCVIPADLKDTGVAGSG